MKKESAEKIMEFDLLIMDILIEVTCKFEMLIFKMARSIKHQVRVAFLFVQTVEQSEHYTKRVKFPILISILNFY